MNVSLALAITGPISWAWLSIRAWRRLRHADKMLDEIDVMLAERRASIDKANADLLTVKMLRAHSERQASTQRASFYKGTEAPV